MSSSWQGNGATHQYWAEAKGMVGASGRGGWGTEHHVLHAQEDVA